MSEPDRLPHLERGDMLPHMLTETPGPACRAASRRLADLEPPGVNTLYGGEDNILWAEALGSNVLDLDGNRYLDLTSGFGVAAIGHRHPRVLDAIHRQSGRLLHGLGDAAGHELRLELAEKLRSISKIPRAQTYFAISGADAVEIALKTALLHHRGEREQLVAFEPAYHGLTLGALAATSRPAFRDPFHRQLNPALERLPFGCDQQLVEKALADRRVAAVIVEPIVGREGVLIPPAGWLTSIRESCRRHGTLLITDEIFTGFGRTGQLFAAQEEGVTPDLLCCGKALGGGLPIGVVLGSREIMSAWETPGEALHTATFLAHPVACATSLAVLEVLEQENLILRARDLGKTLGERLAEWPKRFPCVVEVRGRGLLWGLELRTSRSAAVFVSKARDRGILILAGGPSGCVAQVVPPLTIAKFLLDHALTQLEEVLVEMDADRADSLEASGRGGR